MSIVPSNFTDLHKTVDSLFRDFASALPGPTRRGNFFSLSGDSSVRCDIQENQDNYVVWMDLPGVNKDQVRLTGKESEVYLEVHLPELERDDLDKFVVMQRYHGNTWRKIQFPEDIKIEEAKANFQNGVLCLMIPKESPKKQEYKEIPLMQGGEGHERQD
jgi:HSP20 family protein